MRIKTQDEILDPTVRKRLIEEIEGAENVSRKSIAFKRWSIWKNKSKVFVRQLLGNFLDESTVKEMEYSISNISIAKKIVDKLAKVYCNGVHRTYGEDEADKALSCVEDKLEINLQMKTANKLLKLLRNAVLYIKPVESVDNDGEVMRSPSIIPMSSHLYDVVEMHSDRTKPMVFILSNFDLDASSLGISSRNISELAAKHDATSTPLSGDGIDQTIADKKEDTDEGLEQKKVYVWWTDKYHFTTLGSEVVDPSTMVVFQVQEGEALGELVLNPIEEMPFVDLHIDQEGTYWAEGGDDLIDGDLLVNSMLSNAHHIGITQGFGQLVMIGKDLPSAVKLGPNKTILLPTDDEAGQTSAEYITANPPLDALAKQVEMYVALLLTTNNLSTSGVQAALSGGQMAASGIALAIDKSDSLEDVKDQRDIFVRAEKGVLRKIAKWLQYFDEQEELDPEFKDCKIPHDKSPTTDFADAQILVTEAEKLANLKLREELGINTAVELIMKDRGINEAEANNVLIKITADSVLRLATMRGEKPEVTE